MVLSIYSPWGVSLVLSFVFLCRITIARKVDVSARYFDLSKLLIALSTQIDSVVSAGCQTIKAQNKWQRTKHQTTAGPGGAQL